MDSFLGLLRLAIERGWTFGLLLIAFCGSALLAARWGLMLPPSVVEWSGAGLLFGAAVLVVSLVMLAGGAISAWSQHLEAQAGEQRNREEDNRDVIQNLSTLNNEELAAFVELLQSGAPRFEVHILSSAHPLMQKGILVPVRSLAGASWLCEFHSAIKTNKDKLLPGAQAALRERRGY